MNIANGHRLTAETDRRGRVIAERKVQRSTSARVAGKVFFETCGIGIVAICSARSPRERGRWGGVPRIVRWATANSHRVEITVTARPSATASCRS